MKSTPSWHNNFICVCLSCWTYHPSSMVKPLKNNNINFISGAIYYLKQIKKCRLFNFSNLRKISAKTSIYTLVLTCILFSLFLFFSFFCLFVFSPWQQWILLRKRLLPVMPVIVILVSQWGSTVLCCVMLLGWNLSRFSSSCSPYHVCKRLKVGKLFFAAPSWECPLNKGRK